MESWRGPLITGGVVVGVIALSIILEIKLVAAVVIGVQFGAVYALIALGVALVYKATRVLNFAQGEVGTLGAWLVWLILAGFSVADDADAITGTSAGKMLLATLVAIVAAAGLSILINAAVVQRLASSSPVTSLVATAGVMILLLAVQLITFDAKIRPYPRFINGAPNGIDAGPICLAKLTNGGTAAPGQCVGDLAIAGQVITWHIVIVVAVLVLAAAGLAIFFKTPVGVALLATAQDPFAAEIQGVSVRAMSSLAWGMAGALAAVGGVLGAGVFANIQPGLITSSFLIAALVSAVLGGVTSMPGAVVGGLILGITVAFTNETVLALDLTLPGAPQVAAFTVLIMVLLFRPRGLFGKAA